MLEMLEPCRPGLYLIPTDFIHQACGDHPFFRLMDMERKLHVLLSDDWENHLFLQGFHEAFGVKGLQERLTHVQDWITTRRDFITGIRTDVRTYYEAIFGFSLEGAVIYVNRFSSQDALVSIQPRNFTEASFRNQVNDSGFQPF